MKFSIILFKRIFFSLVVLEVYLCNLCFTLPFQLSYLFLIFVIDLLIIVYIYIHVRFNFKKTSKTSFTIFFLNFAFYFYLV